MIGSRGHTTGAHRTPPAAWVRSFAAVLALCLFARIGFGHAQLLHLPTSVGQVLEQYRLALEHKDLDHLTTLYVTFSERQRAALQEYLENAAGLSVELVDITVAQVADGVAVSYTRRDHFIDRASGKPQRLEVRLTKILVPDNGQWKIRGGS